MHLSRRCILEQFPLGDNQSINDFSPTKIDIEGTHSLCHNFKGNLALSPRKNKTILVET